MVTVLTTVYIGLLSYHLRSCSFVQGRELPAMPLYRANMLGFSECAECIEGQTVES